MADEQKLVVKTREEAEILLGQMAKHRSKRNRMAEELNAAITNVRMDFDGKIQALDESLAVEEKAIEDWAKTVPEQFAEKKSIELLHGVIGFRMCKPVIEPLKRVTWKLVLKRLKKAVKWKRYIRIKKEPDRVRLLTDARREGGLKADDLKALGLHVVQEENFFIDLKLEATT